MAGWRSLGRRHASARTGVALAAAAALTVSACGGEAPGAGKRTELPGVLEFGLSEQEFADHVERVQQLIADCMNAAGFEYVPVDVKTIQAGQKRMRSDPGYTRRTYKEKWGLGVTTRFDNPVRDVGLGPNLRIWHGLPPADQKAYARTLWGENANADFVFTLDEENFSDTGGCTRKAVAQVFTPQQMEGNYVNPKDVLVDSDPRIAKARRDWSRCMKDHGYDYQEDQDEIIEEYQDRLNKLLDGDEPRLLTGSRAAALRELQQEEIAVSLADLDCQVRFTDDIYDQVEIEVYGKPVSG